ncbi:MAG: leucine-rich repeat domain-containing protein [bacterium]
MLFRRLRKVYMVLALFVCLQSSIYPLLPYAASAGSATSFVGGKTAIALPVDYSGSQPNLAEKTALALVRNYAAVHAPDNIIRLRDSSEKALFEARKTGANSLIVTEVLRCNRDASRTVTLEVALFALDVKSGNIKAASFSVGRCKARLGGSSSINGQIDEALDRAVRAALSELGKGLISSGKVEACLGGNYKLSLQSSLKEGIKVASFNGAHITGIMKIRSAGKQDITAELETSFSSPQQGDTVLIQIGDVSVVKNKSKKSGWIIGALAILGVAALSGNGGNGKAVPAEELAISAVPGNGVVYLSWTLSSQNPNAYIIYRKVVTAASAGITKARKGGIVLRQTGNSPAQIKGQQGSYSAGRTSTDKQGFERLQQVEGNINSYSDYSVSNGNVYEYGVSYIKNGVESRLCVCSNSVCPDGTLPVVIITAGPSHNSVIDYSNVTFTWQGEDAVTPPDRLRFTFSLDSDLPAGYVADRSASYINLADGVHEFKIRAIDEAGNIGETITRSFTVAAGSQKRFPEVTIQSVTPNPTAGSQTVTVTARAIAFDAAQITAGYAIADNPLTSNSSWTELSVSLQGDGSYLLEGNYSVSALSEGLHSIYVRAMDSRELCTVSQPFSLQVSDAIPPPVQLVPDNGLRAAILAKQGLPAEHELTIADLQNMSGELQAYNRGVTDLEGIQYCTGLSRLIIYSNSITNITQLQDLTDLETLDLGDNMIVDINALQNLVAIKTLSLENNRVTDISSLVANPGLASGDGLYLKGNPLDFNGVDTPARIAVNTLRSRGVAVDTGLGGISGTSTDLSGIRGYARIAAFRIEGFNAQNPGLPVNGIVDPPASGEFNLRDLPDGNYYVGAFVDIDNDGLFEPGDGEPGAWYGGDTNPTVLNVSAVSSPSGIFIIIPAP